MSINCNYCNLPLPNSNIKHLNSLFMLSCDKCKSKFFFLNKKLFISKFFITHNNKYYFISHNYRDVITTISIGIYESIHSYKEIYSHNSLLDLTPQNTESKLNTILTFL